jgi:hypothetical protein
LEIIFLIGIGYIIWIGNNLEFGFEVLYILKHKNGRELELDMDLNKEIYWLGFGYGFEIGSCIYLDMDLKLVHAYIWI